MSVFEPVGDKKIRELEGIFAFFTPDRDIYQTEPTRDFAYRLKKAADTVTSVRASVTKLEKWESQPEAALVALDAELAAGGKPTLIEANRKYYESDGWLRGKLFKKVRAAMKDYGHGVMGKDVFNDLPALKSTATRLETNIKNAQSALAYAEAEAEAVKAEEKKPENHVILRAIYNTQVAVAVGDPSEYPLSIAITNYRGTLLSDGTPGNIYTDMNGEQMIQRPDNYTSYQVVGRETDIQVPVLDPETGLQMIDRKGMPAMMDVVGGKKPVAVQAPQPVQAATAEVPLEVRQNTAQKKLQNRHFDSVVKHKLKQQAKPV